ncbi:MAG TPA: DUF5695 domain-containing protein [Acidobacteriaceae bacterium]|nr:DUF5695 domain-containing protein [Acidobacteriaceae bacterium]
MASCPFRSTVAPYLIMAGLALPSAAQAPAASPFKVEYSASGISSLKRVQDKYDTDYIQSGHALGDLFIRYRPQGTSSWNEISAATRTRGESAGAATYTIDRLAPTLAGSAQASASVRGPGTRALSAAFDPSSSSDIGAQRFTWTGKTGSTEWVEYDFDQPQTLHSAEVYWAADSGRRITVKLPVAWKVQYKAGGAWSDVEQQTQSPIAANAFNQTTFRPVTTTGVRLAVQLAPDASAGLLQWRLNGQPARLTQPVDDLKASESFKQAGDALVWTITLRNATDKPLEVGDLGIGLPMNRRYVSDKTETYTKRVIQHASVAGDGSFLYWMRTNAEGPYLVMAPARGSSLEYFEELPATRTYYAFLHAAASMEELKARGGNWRLPITNLVLAPNQTKTYSFRFRWAPDYDGVRQVLYQEGLFDVAVVPGMTVPTDLDAEFSLHTRNAGLKIEPEHPEQTTIASLGERGKDIHVYKVHFARLGENMLKVRYGDGQYLSLEFFVTEPIETLFKKRAAFIVSHEQHTDPAKWYNGLLSQWDMKDHILRSPDDLDGLQSYAVACDDPELGKAAFIAGKDIVYPDAKEIAAVEYYIQHYVWGGLQETTSEKFPYAIYGIPNWKVNRDSADPGTKGQEHVWRIYDYPHIVLMYYNMYRVAKLYPEMTKYLDSSGYLERAFGTAKAFFTVPMELIHWSPFATGTYNEIVIPDLIDALDQAGKHDEAAWLRGQWEKKVEYFINDHPYLYGSEYPYDTTGFESTAALAKYAMARVEKPGAPPPAHPLPGQQAFAAQVKYDDAKTFLDGQFALNVASRGWLETAYYDMGSDLRANGNISYTLSYMSQMGGWGILDYAYNQSSDPAKYLRLGYPSYLSSFALINSGTAESNYGYWYPGKDNDGGASGGFEPRPWGRAWLGNKEMGRGAWWYDGEIELGFSGALRDAAAVVVDDPIFGRYAYGGVFSRAGAENRVVPHDGLRERLHILTAGQRADLELDRDAFAEGRQIAYTDSLSRIAFTLENHASSPHSTAISLTGVPAGNYRLLVDNKTQSTLATKDGSLTLQAPVSGPQIAVELVRVSK